MCPDAVNRLDTYAFGAEIFRFADDMLGDNAVFDNLLLIIKITDKHIQRLKPLLEPSSGLLPLLG